MTPRPAAVDGDWHRVHPVSPLVRGWVALVAVLFIIGQNAFEDIYRAATTGALFANTGALGLGAAIVGGVFLLILGGFFLSWRFTRYRMGADKVEVRSGVVFRQHRHARLDRVQAVDIKQPLLARIAGLAELKFETADGGDSAMSLSFLRMDEARMLRQEIMRRAAGIQSGQDPVEAAEAPADEGPGLVPDAADPAIPSPPARPSAPSAGSHPSGRPGPVVASGIGYDYEEETERVMLRVPPGRLIGATLTGSGLVSAVLVFGILYGAGLLAIRWWMPESVAQEFFAEVGSALSVPALLGILFGVGSSIWSSVNGGWNFTVASIPDGLRLRYGLLDTTSQTVPPGRIQAVKVSRPLLWRLFGWYRMAVTVAGYGESPDGTTGKSRLLPVGTFDDVLRVLTVVAPDPGVGTVEEARELVHAALDGSGADHGFVTTTPRMRWFSPLVWRRHGFRSTRSLLMIRSGRLNRELVLLPHERIQSLQLLQGPVERWRGAATVTFHIPPGPISPRVDQLDAAVAMELFRAEREVAAQARRLRDRNEWMRPDELARFEQRTRQVVE
ncbi:PH domain-containing protein [Citricoccus sp.]|uniref:PH domain-containing protein n=1 Tax=Citricoccus sp. TaxID=1978372 RepID=UPI00260C1D71|nr:PH domain-containing protein [Citricoccus sp.]HRO30759.1 PH domain-containing protein [Citricoccus sp.]HRO95062.1 PH domain-containing protein [Citricoccus sp.]